jgi:hypothetical protein
VKVNQVGGNYQAIDVPIKVVGRYRPGQGFIPVKFHWQDRTLAITRITLQSDLKDGEIKKRWYSVLVGSELYRIEFNRESEQWRLKEIWVE